jgi:hypothetical protein
MTKCKTCKHWTQISNWKYDNAIQQGICKGILGSVKVEINLRLGWEGGYVESIETDEDFGCALYEKK